MDLGHADARSRSSRDRVWADRCADPRTGQRPLHLVGRRADALLLASDGAGARAADVGAASSRGALTSRPGAPARPGSLHRGRALPRRVGDARPAAGLRVAHTYRGRAAGLDRLERAHLRRDARRRLTWTGRPVLRLRADGVRRAPQRPPGRGRAQSARRPQRALRTQWRMTMDDQHIDGNGIADVVGEVAGAEMSPSCARASPAATAGRSASPARTGQSASSACTGRSASSCAARPARTSGSCSACRRS